MADERSGDDTLEQGSSRFRLPDWRPSRGAQVLAVAALVIGLAAGYAAGSSGARGSAAGPQPTVTVTASPPAPAPAASFSVGASLALSQDTGACSVQTGRDDLELGIQFTNQSTQPVTLTTARAVVPPGVLKQLTWQWGTCGALNNGLSQGADMLLPGQSTWLTVTFKVKAACPGPYHVQFSVGYLVRGHAATSSLPGFADLGQVPYSGCASARADAQNSEITGVSP